MRIAKVQYTASKRELQVQATSTASYAVLTVSSAGQGIGTLTFSGGDKYLGTFLLNANPGVVTITSDQGGSAAASVPSK